MSDYDNGFRLYKKALIEMNIGNDDIQTNGEANLLKMLSTDHTEGVIFDVGANVGEYTECLYQTFGDERKIFSFEPSSKSFDELCKHSVNREWVLPHQIAFSDESGTAILYSDKEKSKLASLYKRHLESINIDMNRQEEVYVDTIDEFCDNYIFKIFLLKLDVEGNELKVLKGAKRMIEMGNIKNIQFEFGGCNIDSRIFFRDFWEMLSDKYDFYRIMPDRLVLITAYSELFEIFTSQNFFLKLK